MPRIPLIGDRSEVPAEHHAVVDHVLQVFNNIRGPSSVLLHSPKLCDQVISLGDYFRADSVVEARARSVGILVAVRERQGVYVWAAQANGARRNGVPEEVIDLIRQRAAPARFPPGDREIVAYVEQLMRTTRIEPAVFDALKQGHSTQWLVELTTVVNYYAMLCGITSAFEVPAPANGDPLPK